jgi:uncharacterized protein with PQ loop repeat
MLVSVETISIVGMWAAQVFYVLCYIPQIVFNHKHKTGRGLSDLMLLGYFNCLVAVLYYVFLCDLPLAYKLLPPLQVVATLVLILQRLLYDDFRAVRPYWLLYGGNVIGVLFFIPLALRTPIAVGWAAGWVMFVVACVNQLPQIAKIFREKSVANFSILFAGITLVAASIS